jgi:hypothetical protein
LRSPPPAGSRVTPRPSAPDGPARVPPLAPSMPPTCGSARAVLRLDRENNLLVLLKTAVPTKLRAVFAYLGPTA